MIQERVLEIFEKIREPMALDRWTIGLANTPSPEGRATCEASPEYREAVLNFDFDKLQTGDDLDELVVHESTHCHIWPLHALAENLAQTLAKTMPESHREPMMTMLREEVRLAAEAVTTDVGHTYLRLLRRAGVLDTPQESV